MPPTAQNTPTRLPDLPEGPSLDRLRGPLEAPLTIDWGQVALAVLVGAALVALLFWTTRRYLRLRRSRRPAPDPRQTARAQIEAAALASDDDTFARLVAEAVRTYLRDGPQLYQGHKTTEELLRSDHFPNHLRERAHSLFATCDQTKFAGRPLGAEERIEIINTAKKILEAPFDEPTPHATHYVNHDATSKTEVAP